MAQLAHNKVTSTVSLKDDSADSYLPSKLQVEEVAVSKLSSEAGTNILFLPLFIKSKLGIEHDMNAIKLMQKILV